MSKLIKKTKGLYKNSVWKDGMDLWRIINFPSSATLTIKNIESKKTIITSIKKFKEMNFLHYPKKLVRKLEEVNNTVHSTKLRKKENN